MKKLYVLTLTLLLLMGIYTIPVSAKEAFIIKDLDIAMQVEEDGTYYVTEHFLLDFSEYRHGFYRTIPTRYEMKWTDENGNADYKTYYFPIDQISCGSSPTCDIEVSSGGVKIQIGDPDVTVIGEQRYTISYRIHTKDLGMGDKQMLYWNLIGNGFNTTIQSMHYTITMPKDFDETRISTYTGAYGAAYDGLSFEVKDQVISGELLMPLYSYESATIMVPLASDYFTFPQPKDYLLYATIASVVIALFSGLLFWRFGKDDEVVVTVEFQPPEGLDSAAVGYVVDSIVDKKDVISLILDWANRGYLQILDDGKDHLSLQKLKDMDPSDTKPYERTFFKALFKNGDLVEEADLKETHVGMALNSAQKKVSQYYGVKKRRVFANSSFVLQIFMCVMVALPSFLCTMASFYMSFEMMEMTFPCIIIGLFGIVAAVPWVILMRKRYVMKRWHYLLLWGLCFLGNSIIFAIVSLFMFFMGPGYAWIYVLIYLALEVFQLFVLMFMDKRTKLGNRWLGQILGLQEFIVSCEKDRLEILAKEDPSAFFHILPYAYVLGVSDVWVNKFEGLIIAQPDWYVNPYHDSTFSTWIWWNHFHHNFHRLSRSIAYVESNTGSGGHGSGGGSFSGGGFSGGFSGGGFGGGGGGSW